MENLKVVRVEHPFDGLGYFRALDENGWERNIQHSCRAEISERHRTNEFPTFFSDDELYTKFRKDYLSCDILDYNFAYNSLDQLKSGFTTEEIKECIEKLGFRVLMYTLESDYYQSKYQVIFKKDKAVSVEDISSLFL